MPLSWIRSTDLPAAANRVTARSSCQVPGSPATPGRPRRMADNGGRPRPGLHAQLGVDVLDVRGDRLTAELQLSAAPRVGPPAGAVRSGVGAAAGDKPGRRHVHLAPAGPGIGAGIRLVQQGIRMTQVRKAYKVSEGIVGRLAAPLGTLAVVSSRAAFVLAALVVSLAFLALAVLVIVVVPAARAEDKERRDAALDTLKCLLGRTGQTEIPNRVRSRSNQVKPESRPARKPRILMRRRAPWKHPLLPQGDLLMRRADAHRGRWRGERIVVRLVRLDRLRGDQAKRRDRQSIGPVSAWRVVRRVRAGDLQVGRGCCHDRCGRVGCW